tara:strand:+ start:1809 stop:2093 length:285 start_codon:yes stop_codon:yes gene_type:complete
MLEQDKDGVIANLKDGVCEVTFTKVNGEERVMQCTLNPDLLPELPTAKPDEGTAAKPKKAPNPDVQPVYDINAAGWRSFRWDSVTNFTKLDSEK